MSPILLVQDCGTLPGRLGTTNESGPLSTTLVTNPAGSVVILHTWCREQGPGFLGRQAQDFVGRILKNT